MTENNKTVSAPVNNADKGAPVANKKINKNFISRPKNWPRVDMKAVKKAVGMLNDTEYKLMVLTCKDAQTTIDLIKTLRDINGKDEQNLYRIIFKLAWVNTYPGKAMYSLEDEQPKEEAKVVYDNPAHLNKDKDCKCDDEQECPKDGDVVTSGYVEEVPSDNAEEESDDPEPETGKEVGQEKTEEDIEKEAEDYKQYEDMMDDNAEKNARPSVKKSEQYK